MPSMALGLASNWRHGGTTTSLHSLAAEWTIAAGMRGGNNPRETTGTRQDARSHNAFTSSSPLISCRGRALSPPGVHDRKFGKGKTLTSVRQECCWHRRAAPNPNSRVESPQPDPCRALPNPRDRINCPATTQPDDIHLWLRLFIRPIAALTQNVGFCCRPENGFLGYLGTVSGRSKGPTRSDIVLPAPLWNLLVRSRLANLHRFQPHIRHGHPRCGPLLN